MICKKDFDDVDKPYFVETFDKLMQEKHKRMFELYMLADNDSDLVISAPPPPER